MSEQASRASSVRAGIAGTKWTDEQWDAITVRGCDLLVSAAAGAGKTSVLVGRVVSRVTDPADPVDIDRMLIVTFTDAAAAEMRARIESALAEALAAEPGNVRLSRQVALVGKADISTIHSFCHRVVRQYFYRLDLDPTFRVMDELEAELLRVEVAEDVLERCYDDPDLGEAFTALVDRYGGPVGDDALKDIVLRLYRYSRSRPDPSRWFRGIRAMFEIPQGASVDDLAWSRTILDAISRGLAHAERRLAEAAELAASPGGPAAYLSVLQEERTRCSDALAACRGRGGDGDRGRWKDVAAALAACTFGRLPAARAQGCDAALKERVKDLRAAARATVDQLREAYCSRTGEELVEDVRAVAPHADALLRVVEAFADAYDAAKRARTVLDFSDLEHLCLRVLAKTGDGSSGLASGLSGDLEPSDIAAELAARYEEVLVDEYQDINPVQDAILRLVSRERGSFAVGDVKQSIYRFRLAEPGLFASRYREYPRSASGSSRRIDLSRNFRSRRQIVDAVNFVFRQVLVGGASEVGYGEDAELVCGAEFPDAPAALACAPCHDAPVELHIIERASARNATATPERSEPVPAAGAAEGASAVEPGGTAEREAAADDAEAPETGSVEGWASEDAGSEDAAAPEELEALEEEARLIAGRIRRMVSGSEERPGPEFSVWDRDRKAYRPVSYRDIVVLMRATKDRANVLLESFRQADVPAYAELGTGYFQATEIQVMLALLRVIDNPRQDIPLAAVLRSPICGLSAEDLARVRLGKRDGDFYDALAACSSRSDLGELAERVGRFLASLERWRTLARRLPLSIVIWELYSETRYLDYVGGMPGGAQRQANLRALHERARQFDRFSRQGLFRFLRFVDELLGAEGDLGTARALGEAEDVVRIMSIHKSKGLEFPVVFLADLGRNFNLRDLGGDVLFHSETGLGLMLCDPVRRVKYPTLAYHATRERRRTELLAEEMRILYVGLTRAKEKLVLVGSAERLAERARRWSGAASVSGWALPDERLLSARSALDWVASAVARHAAGRPIRELGRRLERPADPAVEGDPVRLEVRIWHPAAIARIARGLPVEAREPGTRAHLPMERLSLAEPVPCGLDPDTRRDIEEHVRWTYPWRELTAVAAKAIWPELKRQLDPAADDHDNAQLTSGDAAPVWPALAPLRESPEFARTARISPEERGRAMHVVIQHIDLAGPHGVRDIRAAIEDMKTRDLLRPDLADSVNAEAIARLLDSPLGRRMTSRPAAVRREVPFCLGISVNKLYPSIAAHVAGADRVVVQGVIDCLIDEPDGFVLIDFKTDASARFDPDEAASAYRGQIRLYAAAVEAIYGRPVKEAYLYFLSADLAVKVPTA